MGFGRVTDQIANQRSEFLLWMMVCLVMAVQKDGELGVSVVSRFVGSECIGLQYGRQAIDWISGALSCSVELLEVGRHLALMPATEDRLDVGVVLVEVARPIPVSCAI